MKKAILTNIKLSILVYLSVALICTCAFVFLPRNLQSNIEMLRTSVQSKQLLVNSLKAHPEEHVFTVPKEAATWINQLPPDAQINRALIQLDSLMKKTDMNFQSISLADGHASDVTTNTKQVLNEILGKAEQSGSGQKAQQGLQTISLNLAINGSYYSVLDFLYGLVHSDRLVRIDSIQLTYDNSADQQNRPINSQAQNSNSPSSFQSGNSGNANSMTTSQVNGVTNTTGVSSKVTGTENHQADSSATTLLKSLLAGTLAGNSQPNANQNLGDMPKYLTSMLPVSPQPSDTVSVSLELSIFYMQDAAVLGSVPNLSLYPPSDRTNPFLP